MISPTSGTVTFGETFSLTISVFSETSTIDPESGLPVVTQVPSTTLPVVTASFVDPTVVITPSIGQVVISGKYSTILPLTWTYLNNNGVSVTSPSAPLVGSFSKILQVDSPPKLTETCTYTIDGSAFVHTVTLGSYTPIATQLKSLLATI